MSQLGSSATGTTFSISGSFNQSQSSSFTTPANGCIIDNLNCIVGANGSASNARLYVWRTSDNVWVIRSGIFSLAVNANPGTITRTDLSGNTAVTGYPGLFIPDGVGLNFGVWVSSANYNWKAAPSGTSHIGTGGDGNYVDHGAAVGPGVLAAWINYHSCFTKIRRSGVWVTWPEQIRRSGAWSIPPIFVRRSGVWIQLQ